MNTPDPSETITCSPTDNTHYGINYYPCGHIHSIFTIIYYKRLLQYAQNNKKYVTVYCPPIFCPFYAQERTTQNQTTMTIRYEFLIKTPDRPDGMKVAVDQNIVNQLSARHRITRLYPSANTITFIRSYRIN